LRSHHIVFGDEKPLYQSSIQANFVKHKIDPDKTDKQALADDLRSIITTFNLKNIIFNMEMTPVII